MRFDKLPMTVFIFLPFSRRTINPPTTRAHCAGHATESRLLVATDSTMVDIGVTAKLICTWRALRLAIRGESEAVMAVHLSVCCRETNVRGACGTLFPHCCASDAQSG